MREPFQFYIAVSCRVNKTAMLKEDKFYKSGRNFRLRFARLIKVGYLRQFCAYIESLKMKARN